MTRYASAHSELVAASPEDACELDRTEKLEPMRTTNWRRTNDVHKFESNSSSSPLCASAAGRSRCRAALARTPAKDANGHCRGHFQLICRRAYDLGPWGWKGGVLIMLPIRGPPAAGTWPH